MMQKNDVPLCTVNDLHPCTDNRCQNQFPRSSQELPGAPKSSQELPGACRSCQITPDRSRQVQIISLDYQRSKTVSVTILLPCIFV